MKTVIITATKEEAEEPEEPEEPMKKPSLMSAAPPPPQATHVKCFGCGKHKTIVTHSNKLKQAFCGACNMRLIRAFGEDYGDDETGLDNPQMSLRALIERKEQKKDIKAVRKIKYQLLNLMDDCDFESDRKARVLAEFADVFSGLDETVSHFTASV